MTVGMSVPEPSWHGADPDLPDFRSTLHERYRHLREAAPVSLTPKGHWRLAKHADCVRLLETAKVGLRTTEGALPGNDESRDPEAFPFDRDPPNPARLRKLAARCFTPQALAALEPHVVGVTENLLDRLAGHPEIELISALAKPLPTAIIGELMGVLPTDQRTFAAGVHERIEERRGSPSDDLLSVLVRTEQDGDRSSPDEVVWLCVGLVLAGLETTTGLIANGLRQLLLQGEWKRLVDDRGVVDTLVEECLRFDPPVTSALRVLHEDADFGGYLIPKNSQVLAVLAAANRDPDVFERPDTMDVTRSPNPHLGFVDDLHSSLAAPLVRLEARVAFTALAARFPKLELAERRGRWSPSRLRIPAELRVRTA